MTARLHNQRTHYSLPLPGRPVFKAVFLSRPNRFLVECQDITHGVIRAFLPNPGRLSELLFPGVTLHVLDNSDDSGERATQFTVVAVDRNDRPVMLHTHWCNEMAQSLLTHHAVPGLEQAHIVHREVKAGHSRFDFLLEDKNGRIYLEVKSCTLFGNGVAMFPDAVTERGKRHFLELSDLAGTGQRCYVLFIVQTDQVCCFMPDYHTDMAFARTMLAVRERGHFMALPVSWTKKLSFEPAKSFLPIPWDYIEREANDQGAYLAVLHLNCHKRLTIGALGTQSFSPGYYTYAGSAMGGLDARMARHNRKRKKKHWHIDYLRADSEVIAILPVRSSERLECRLVAGLTTLLSASMPGFGCTDCHCPTHLFFSTDNPLEQPRFHDWLQRMRMRPPNGPPPHKST